MTKLLSKKPFCGLVAALLTVLLLLSVTPIAAFAAGWSGVSIGGIGFNYGSDGFINITMPVTYGYYTYGSCDTTDGVATAEETASDSATLPESGWNWAVKKETSTINGDDYSYTVTFKDFNLSYSGTNDAVMVKAHIKVILQGSSVINAASAGTGLSGTNGSALYIDGTGSLNIDASYVAIGGPSITIAGGIIEACADNSALSGTIKITDGTVTAKSVGKTFFQVPDISDYSSPIITVSRNIDGTDTEVYDTANFALYKYFHIEHSTAAMLVDFDGDGENEPIVYYDFAEGWNAAVGSDNTANTTVKLLTDWTAAGEGTFKSFGTGIGFGDGSASGIGYIRVLSGKIITIDLNGFDIDRALTSSVGSSEKTAGWVIGDYGELTIKDNSSTDTALQGKITGGYNSFGSLSSGGIYVGTESKLNIDGGNITGNKSINWGGGVYTRLSSVVTMTGGKISGNIANYDNDNDGGAGGIILRGTFIMTGGEISGNYSCGSTSGGGIHVYSNGQPTIGGTAVIRDNISGSTFSSGTVSGGNADNVYLTNGETITCSATTNLASGAYIGVTTQTAPTADNQVAITGSNSVNNSGYFHSDNAAYTIYNDTSASNTIKLNVTPTITVTHALTKLTATADTAGEIVVINGGVYTTTLTAATDFVLPDTITVTIGGEEATAGTDYTYDSTTGIVTVSCTELMDAIVITAEGVENNHKFGNWTSNNNKTHTRVCAYNASHTETADCSYRLEGAIPANCEITGERRYTCIVCGDTYTEIIPLLDHDWDEGVITTEPTCTETGVRTFTCVLCGDTYTESVDALGHDWDEGVITTEPTCTETGVRTFTCVLCGDTYTESVDALGHTAGEWTVVTPATCTGEGLRELRCTICGELLNSEIISATAHTDADNDNICDDCGEEIKDEIVPGGIIDTVARYFAHIFYKIMTAIENVLFGW